MQSDLQARTADDPGTAASEPDWDEVWLPSWINDAAAPQEPPVAAGPTEPRLDPEAERQLAADLQAVDRLATLLLAGAAAAFEASVAAWAHDPPEERSAGQPSAGQPSAEQPSAEQPPLEAERPLVESPEAVPRIVSPPVARRRPRIWLAGWGALLAAGVVIGLFLASGSSGRAALSASAQDRPDVIAYAQDPTTAGGAAATTAAVSPPPVVAPTTDQQAPVPVVSRAVVPVQRAAVPTRAVPPVAPEAPSAVVSPPGGSAPTGDPTPPGGAGGATDTTSPVSPCGPASPSATETTPTSATATATSTPAETTQATETSAAQSSPQTPEPTCAR